MLKVRKMRRISTICLIIGALAINAGNFCLADDWPQSGFEPQHTGFNPNEKILGPYNVGDLEVAWTNSTPCTVCSPSVVDGIVYYGHYCGEIRAVDAETGQAIWSRSLDGLSAPVGQQRTLH